MAARMPLDQLFGFLRTQDSHPPLDYLLRLPLARAARRTRCCASRRSRAPSVPSCSSHGGCAAAERLGSSPRRCSPAARSRSTTAAKPGCTPSSSSSVSPPRSSPNAGSVTIRSGGARGLPPGSSPSRSSTTSPDSCSWPAWWPSPGFAPIAAPGCGAAASRGALAVWVAVWGASFAPQAGGGWVGWIPRTSPSSFARAVSGQVTDVSPLAWLVLAGVVAGGWCMWRADRRVAPRLADGRCRALPGRGRDRGRLTVPHRSRRDRRVVGATAGAGVLRGCAPGALVTHRTRAVVVALLAVVVIGTATFLVGKHYDSDLAVDHLAAVVPARRRDPQRARALRDAPGVPDRGAAVGRHTLGRHTRHRQRVGVPCR